MSTQTRATFPWMQSAVLAAPAIVLCVLSGMVGATSLTGLVLLGASFVYLIVDLLVLQVKLENALLDPGVIESALEEFLKASGGLDSAAAVAEEINIAIDRVAGSPIKTALVAPEADGGIEVISTSTQLNQLDIGDRAAAFLWLGDNEEPLLRQQLVGIEDSGGVDTASLMDAIGANVLIPLRHRGDLLGVLLVDSPLFQGDEKLEFLVKLRSHATIALANAFLNVETRGRSGVTKTLGLANVIQAALMPEERPIRRASWELRGLFRPVADCGGDLWGWHELPGNQVLILIADATGHGAGPALLSAVAKGTMDAHAQLAGSDCDPSALLAALNSAVYRVAQRSFMMTAFAIVIDIDRGEMRFANAGQNFPFLIRNDQLEALVVRGDQLGASEGATFQTHTKPILPGDKIFLYTDGIVEAGEPVIPPFGERRFRRLIQSLGPVAAADMPHRVLAEVETYLEDNVVHDDITMVAFELFSEGAVF